METREIRLRNLLELASGYKRFAEFCEKIDMSPSYFSQIKSGTKDIGDKIARKVEVRLGIPRGYLDVPHQQVPAGDTSDSIGLAFAINALHPAIREQLRRLIFIMAAHATAPAEIHPFRVELNEQKANSVPIKRKG